MAITHYASPFAPLALSPSDRTSLQCTADALVDEAQLHYERFLWQDHETLDKHAWSLVRERDELRVYQDRDSKASTGRRDVRRLLTVGKVQGTLNDAMFGELSASTEAMRVKTAYIDNTLRDSVVLESLVKPTHTRPFQSLSVRWVVKGVPLHLRAVSKHRDFVYLEATGMRKLSNGETFGYHVMHSITFDKTPALAAYKRGNMSVCTLWRQAVPGRVQVFMLTDIEVPESFRAPLIVKSMADAFLAVGKVVECAQMKKLAWLVERKLMNTVRRGQVASEDPCCSVCGATDRSTRRGVKSNCALCAKITCNKCRSTRQRKMFTPDGQILTHAVRFCLPCLASATCMDAAMVAEDEAVESRDCDDSDDDLRCTLGKMFKVPVFSGSATLSKSGSKLRSTSVDTDRSSCRSWRETMMTLSMSKLEISDLGPRSSAQTSSTSAPPTPNCG